MSTSQRPGLLVDVDGTLVDTTYLHALAWSRALRDLGEWVPMNAIHRLVGMGGDQLVPTLLGREIPEANEARGRRFRELLEDVRPFPAATELLRTVHDSGISVVLATSSPKAELDFMRELLEADEFIDAQTTADDVHASKPDPEVFQTAIKTAGIDPDHALAVGDSTWDVQGALASGLGCVGGETGGFSRQELKEAGAVEVFRDVEEVVETVLDGSSFWSCPLIRN